MYKKWKDNKLEILAFISNEFDKGKAGDDEAISKFYKDRFKATFPIFANIKVNGFGSNLLWKYLQSIEKFKGEIKGDWTKFLVDAGGQVIGRFEPKV